MRQISQACVPMPEVFKQTSEQLRNGTKKKRRAARGGGEEVREPEDRRMHSHSSTEGFLHFLRECKKEGG